MIQAGSGANDVATFNKAANVVVGGAGHGGDQITIVGDGRNVVVVSNGDDVVRSVGAVVNEGVGNDTVESDDGLDRVVTDFDSYNGDRIDTGGQHFTFVRMAESTLFLQFDDQSFVAIQNARVGLEADLFWF